MINETITAVPNIQVGHEQDMTALTGVTVILTPNGAVGGVDQRGGAPGTRETDALRPMHLVEKVHAIVLAGGSAYGLDAASGVMRFLEEKGAGFNTGVAKVPIVPSAILFDLAIGDPKTRPDAEMGYRACKNASIDPVAQGCVGAGTGATVGKILGMTQAMKSGIGSACIDIGAGIKVGAIVAVNAFGDIVDPETGKIIAGVRSLHKGPIKIGSSDYFANTIKTMQSFVGKVTLSIATQQNTVIGVVATNGKLTKEEANKVAQMAHNGLAVSIRPAHTMLDGDTIFALSTGNKPCDVSTIGAFAAEAMSKAIVNAVLNAVPLGGLPVCGHN